MHQFIFCGDWHTSISIPLVLEKYFIIRNRITWEREKGRGAKKIGRTIPKIFGSALTQINIHLIPML